MKYLLVLFTLHHPDPHWPNAYEWRRTVLGSYASADVCNGIAADANGEIPFDRDNPPYLACEKG